MEHLHNQWLEDRGRDVQREYARIQAELAGQAKEIQHSGHRGEAVWVDVLKNWLPDHYHIGTRKYLLLEREVNGLSRSGEIDIVIFHPSYPRALRDKPDVMISGVLAAFSVKLTLKRTDLEDALTQATLLHRGIIPRRDLLIGDVVSPLIFGVLTQSHNLGSRPEEMIDNVLKDGRRRVDHPRDDLDIVCIADLNCWARSIAAVTETTIDEIRDWWFKGDGRSAQQAPPLAMLMEALWRKLGNRDSTLKAIADGFLHTGTPGMTVGVTGNKWPISTLISPGSAERPRLMAGQSFDVD